MYFSLMLDCNINIVPLHTNLKTEGVEARETTGRQARFVPSYDTRSRDGNLKFNHRFNPGAACFGTKLQSTWVDFKPTPWRESSLGGSEISLIEIVAGRIMCTRTP